jgi:ABC-type phosphate transport system substrate-binding protein
MKFSPSCSPMLIGSLVVLQLAMVSNAQVSTCGPQPSTINFLGSLDGRRLGFFMALSFQSFCPQSTINVKVTNFTSSASGAGLSAPAGEGLCTDQDIGGMSRPWLSTEATDSNNDFVYQCVIGNKARSSIQVDVAIGALVLIVRRGTATDTCLAKLTGLTMVQLKNIFSSDTVTPPKFSDLDPSCPATTIKITGPPPGSDAAFLFRSVAGFASYHPRYDPRANDIGVQTNTVESSLGIISYSLFKNGENNGNVRAISIQNENGRFVAPTAVELGTTHNDGKTSDLGHNHDKGRASEYPLAYRLYFNVLQSSLAKTRPFLEYVLSAAGTSAIAVNALVALPASERVVMRARLGLGVPTPAPTMAPGGGGIVVCFPGSATVEVQDKGMTKLSDLKIGDSVKVAENKFDRVYSFGHYDADVVVDQYLAIHAGLELPLEVSPNHLVFTKTSPGAIAASKIQVGDELHLGSANSASATVTKIETVTRRGAYAPFTHAGTVVVNGVIASSYVSLDDENAVLSGMAHWLAHLLVAPRRLMCQHVFKRCLNETYNSEGIATWVAPFHKVSEWLVHQHAAILIVSLVPALLVTSVFYAFEFNAFLMVVTLGIVATQSIRKSKTTVLA